MKLSQEIVRAMEVATRGSATVLITGPTGSGKSYLAKKIHDLSSRRNKPFVTVNLASLHEGTFESELFGHERGAFTGADQRRIGKLEIAQGGTVFLDEVGDLPPKLQARLLEFLQARIVSPVGSNREIRLDVRVIAATNKNLPLAVADGEFREDLFHRLRVVSISLAALNERAGEFGEIVHSCLEDLCRTNGKSVLRISEEVAGALEAHDWPGNLRELRNVLEYAVLSSEDGVIREKDLPIWFLRNEFIELRAREQIEAALNYSSAIAAFEKDFLERALQRFRGRISHTARQIGMNKTTLLRRMRTYGLTATELGI